MVFVITIFFFNPQLMLVHTEKRKSTCTFFMTSELLSAVVLTLASRGVQGTGVLRSLNYSLKDLEVTLSFSYSSEMLFDRSIFLKIDQCAVLEKIAFVSCLCISDHDTQHEKSMTLIRQENINLSTSISKI